VEQLHNSIKVSGVNNKIVISKEKWNRAIREAKAALGELQIRRARLKVAIKVFAENAKNGVPWEDVAIPEQPESPQKAG
jgi:hypothetical protein